MYLVLKPQKVFLNAHLIDMIIGTIIHYLLQLLPLEKRQDFDELKSEPLSSLT